MNSKSSGHRRSPSIAKTQTKTRLSAMSLCALLCCALILTSVSLFIGCEASDPSTSAEDLAKSHENSKSDASKSDDAPPETELIAPAGVLPRANNAIELETPFGMMIGEVTETTAVAQVRLASAKSLVDGSSPGVAGVVRFQLTTDSEEASESNLVATVEIEASAEADFIARAYLNGLRENTSYNVRTEIGPDADSLSPGPTGEFKTLAGTKQSRPVSFVVVTGMNYFRFHNAREKADDADDVPAGYPALATILDRRPDYFIGTGDNVYYDTPVQGRAEDLDAMRAKWHEQFIQTRYVDLFAKVPTYWEVDDHDFRKDDCDNSGDYSPSPELARRVLLEQLPMKATRDTTTTYRSYRMSQDLQIWLLENRMHRSPNSMPDGPEKTIWGKDQLAWLKSSLLESDATFKLLITPTPMIGPDDLRKKDNHTNIGGFRHERDSFFAWLKENGLDQQHLYFLCGDRHWQYHSVDPSGFEEFSCGALVDANSRLGRKPGDPQSTDPEGLIKQPYMQNPASGGFLAVSVEPAEDEGGDGAKLTFEFVDEQGELLYSLSRSGEKKSPIEQ